MAPGEDAKDDAPELRITDRRRFTETGDRRDDAALEPEPAPAPDARSVAGLPPEATRAAQHPVDEPPQPAARDRQGASGDTRDPRAGVMDLGIQAVFFVFYQSAMIALGAPDAAGNQSHVDLAEARQAIGLLKALEQKTAGNLDADEAETLRQLLREVQLAYVQVARSAGGAA